MLYHIFFIIILGAFKLYDVDNDGFITRTEMYNIVDAIYQMVVKFLFCYSIKSKTLLLYVPTGSTGCCSCLPDGKNKVVFKFGIEGCHSYFNLIELNVADVVYMK